MDESELRAWRDGRTLPESQADQAWEAYIRGLRAADIAFERVRMVHEPPTEYQRWIYTTTARNVRIGEDVRWLSESDCRRLEMPADDFYLIDDQRVAVLRFDRLGEMVAIDVADDSDTLALYRTYRDRAWAVATSHHLYDPAHGEC
ncbi:hypothetical protein GPZ80_24440 [Actinokineospora sp. HBU206404]|uniref:DUF6879 domain-containing protein n=1 Tax=Actinokineospora xionganensis TaxID=2684470 RepID=A0ABR7LC76_9PSEU|nr:DUF6879 family protein [Actinokineospora xionganensis]MBC6450311.1 hypothetical protein [Actinokineospora xionganensis]